MARKLLVLAVATAFAIGAHCHLACAVSLANSSARTAGARAGSAHHGCKHHHNQKRGAPAPCCVTHSAQLPVLLPCVPEISGAPAGGDVAVAPEARIASSPIANVAANHDPPDLFRQESVQSPRASRAPPPSLVA